MRGGGNRKSVLARIKTKRATLSRSIALRKTNKVSTTASLVQKYLLKWYKSTCFTGTKVQILTLQELSHSE